MSIACVALVDDEAPVRVALGRLLRLADFSVLAFASGEQFLASLAARVPDCVLLDLHLPGLTGLEGQVRLRDAGLQLPVVFISASDDAETARLVRDAGGLCLLHKPFSIETLPEALGRALGSRPARAG